MQPGGEAVESEVIRIGPFNATADGQFLSYLPNLRTLNVLPRQLPAEFMEIAGRFANATSGLCAGRRGLRIAASCSGCTSSARRLMERIELGEPIGYIIIVVGVLGLPRVRLPAHLAWCMVRWP